MEIILHRANSVKQWIQAAKNGWGIEVDLRTHKGIVYLSHDIIKDDKQIECIPSFWSMYEATQDWSNTVVLDCKETGLFKHLHSEFNMHTQYVFADLIVPDQIFIRGSGGRTLTRKSKFENISVISQPGPLMNPNTPEEYWLDYVFTPDDLASFSSIAKDSYVVSPELHKYQETPHNYRHGRASIDFEAIERLGELHLTDDFIKAVYDMGFKGVCTHEPERYAEYS